MRLVAITAAVAVVIIFFTAGYAQTAPADKPLTDAKKKELSVKGCCSRHQGVCGCEWGQVVCCDKSVSKGCACK